MPRNVVILRGQRIQVQRGRRRQVEAVDIGLAGQVDAAVDRGADGQRPIFVLYRAEAEAVVVGARGIEDALIGQGIGAARRHLEGAEIIPSIALPLHGAAVRVEQAPVALGRDVQRVEYEAIAAGGGELVEVGPVGRVQPATGHGTGGQLAGRGQVQHPEPIGAGAVILADADDIGAAVELHRVGRAGIVAVGIVKAAGGDLAVRPPDGIAEGGVVAQSVEQQQCARGGGKAIAIHLARFGDLAGNHRARGDRLRPDRRTRAIVRHRLQPAQREADGDRIGTEAGRSLDQQAVDAAPRQGREVEVPQIIRACDELPPRVIEPRVEVVGISRDGIESDAVPRGGGEGVDQAGIARCQRGLDFGIQCQRRPRAQRQQAEAVSGRGIARGRDRQRPGPGCQVQRRGAADIQPVRVGEGPIADHAAARAGKCPPQGVLIRQAVEDHPRPRRQGEAPGVLLPWDGDRAVGGFA